jgi:hypothetical protein
LFQSRIGFHVGAWRTTLLGSADAQCITQFATASGRPACEFGAPNSADNARVAALTSSRINATCFSLARMAGVDALIAPITVPA